MPGTIVVDATRNVFLGLIDNLHVRLSSRDGTEVYFEDRTVMGTEHHRILGTPRSPLALPEDIRADAVIATHDGRYLISGNAVLDLESNTVVANLPRSIATGQQFAGAREPGGPGPDARRFEHLLLRRQ